MKRPSLVIAATALLVAACGDASRTCTLAACGPTHSQTLRFSYTGDPPPELTLTICVQATCETSQWSPENAQAEVPSGESDTRPHWASVRAACEGGECEVVVEYWVASNAASVVDRYEVIVQTEETTRASIAESADRYSRVAINGEGCGECVRVVATTRIE